MEPKSRFNLLLIFLAIGGVILLHDALMKHQSVEVIPYSEFSVALKEGRISDVVVADEEIRGSITLNDSGETGKFVTKRMEEPLAEKLDQAGVKYSRLVENNFLMEVVAWILPFLLIIGLWMFMMRRMSGQGGVGGGFMAVGKSKAKVYMETDTRTSFEDVAGVDEAKEELAEVVDFLKDSAKYGRLGGRMPKGVLLVGPPGTGKTLLAKAVAGEAGVPFFSISGSEFVEMFVGVGAARVRDLFEQARQKAPCIIFIDELDALGRARTSSPMSGGHDEKEQTLNQLLVEMDGFDSSGGLIILGATNRPEILDPALLRAGRFDRQVLVDRPDKLGRIAILQVHIKKIVLDPELKVEQIAALTPGFTGADLANLCNEAALIATRRQADQVALEDFTSGIERIIAGLEKKNRVLNEKERTVVAYHEMGHALVASALPGSDPVHKVSIIPRGIGALGYTLQRPTEDRFLITREELERKMMVLLGGRAAEKLVFNHLSTGAADDISKATDIARSMVTRYGMEERLGHVNYNSEPVGFLGMATPGLASRQYSEETARDIDSAVKSLVNAAFDRALGVLKLHREVLEESAGLLLTKETLDEQDLSPFKLRMSLPDSLSPTPA